ncbi:hypothetical protein [Marilutibacter chinensis]|uniref:STAS domain-containing protein n=1 Tax=Marilutibacter chinensis TaxID=2912247 RepID=A0ABS9HP76_9GAMM|nr:hypothetical protein [Lysobacter chinensis]MCF7220764.1 hypothetical protein [Lysobacter chinensis]
MIEFPERLSLETLADVEVVANLLREIRSAALGGNFKRITLDHTNVRCMSPDVALMVVAEIQRCEVYCGSRTVITGTHPKSHEVTELLSEVGFYEALDIKPPKLPASYKSRTYVRVERRNKTLPRVVDSLLECFAKEFSFEEADRKRLHVALIECMDNVFEHAYEVVSDRPYLYKEWWLVGYADHQESSIGFVFYDQGAGIPTTIRRKKKKRVLARLAGWADGQWIDRAVRKPISRYASKRRGHGLDKLKQFLDQLGVEGSLRVIANCGDVEYVTTGGGASIQLLNGGIDGSLIVWKLRGVTKDFAAVAA